MNSVVLAGGTGAAKFLRGLCRVVSPSTLTIVVNTGDDLTHWGLQICPDLDTVTYGLAGLLDLAKGWGVAGDSFQCRGMMGKFGEPTYFALGDRDLALHIYRTHCMKNGDSLSRVTERISRAVGVRARMLPMSDDRVSTRVQTPAGWLAFQEFFVRDRCEPEVLDVAYEGASEARAAPGVVEAILSADTVIVCPSNPISSIGPILSLTSISRALSDTAARVVAVSPIVGGTPVSGPAGKMMAAKGYELSVLGVAEAYRGWLDLLVIDEADADHADALRRMGVEPVVTDAIMANSEAEIALSKVVLRAVS